MQQKMNRGCRYVLNRLLSSELTPTGVLVFPELLFARTVQKNKWETNKPTRSASGLELRSSQYVIPQTVLVLNILSC